MCPGYIESSIYESAERINSGTSVRELISFKLVPVDEAVAIILKGVAKNKANIVFPFYGKLFLFIENNFPALLHGINKKRLKDFRSKKRSLTTHEIVQSPSVKVASHT